MSAESVREQEWSTLRTKIKNRFGKLSDSDINGLKGHMDTLTKKVKNAYDYGHSKAERECKEFTDSLNK